MQDLTSRFTLDSATEFLFGGTVGSLDAGIPYPPTSTQTNTLSFESHPSTGFVKAFTEAMKLCAERTGKSWEWRLSEFNQDQIQPLRKVIDDFTDPLLSLALANREKNRISGEKGETTNLLSHLVDHTQGQSLASSPSLWALIGVSDPKTLKDEVCLLSAISDAYLILSFYACSI